MRGERATLPREQLRRAGGRERRGYRAGMNDERHPPRHVVKGDEDVDLPQGVRAAVRDRATEHRTRLGIGHDPLMGLRVIGHQFERARTPGRHDNAQRRDRTGRRREALDTYGHANAGVRDPDESDLEQARAVRRDLRRQRGNAGHAKGGACRAHGRAADHGVRNHKVRIVLDLPKCGEAAEHRGPDVAYHYQARGRVARGARNIGLHRFRGEVRDRDPVSAHRLSIVRAEHQDGRNQARGHQQGGQPEPTQC